MDCVLEYMKRLHAKDPVTFPWTRETYLSLAHWDKDIELDAEGEADLPERVSAEQPRADAG